jgi:hypothetical protein
MSNTYHSFSKKSIQEAIDAAQTHYSSIHKNNFASSSNIAIPQGDTGRLSLAAECIELMVENNKICLDLPLKIGKVCIPIPVSFDAQLVRACLSICTIWGVPTGVMVTVSLAGEQVVRVPFGLGC